MRKSDAARPLSQYLGTADSPEGHRRVADYLKSRPFPYYEADAGRPEMLIRIEENGTRTQGRFINRRFVPTDESDAS